MQPVPKMNDHYDRLCDQWDDIFVLSMIMGNHLIIYIPSEYVEMSVRRLRRDFADLKIKTRRVGNHIFLTATKSRIYIGATQFAQKRGNMNIVFAPKQDSLEAPKDEYFAKYIDYLIENAYSVARY